MNSQKNENINIAGFTKIFNLVLFCALIVLGGVCLRLKDNINNVKKGGLDDKSIQSEKLADDVFTKFAGTDEDMLPETGDDQPSTDEVQLIDSLDWDNVNKTGSSLGDLDIRAAGSVNIADLSNYYTEYTVEGALEEIGADIIDTASEIDGLDSAYLKLNGSNGPITGDLSISSLTKGSIIFAGSGGKLSQDNSDLFWDSTNNKLGIGTTSLTNGKLTINSPNLTSIYISDTITKDGVYGIDVNVAPEDNTWEVAGFHATVTTDSETLWDGEVASGLRNDIYQTATWGGVFAFPSGVRNVFHVDAGDSIGVQVAGTYTSSAGYSSKGVTQDANYIALYAGGGNSQVRGSRTEIFLKNDDGLNEAGYINKAALHAMGSGDTFWGYYVDDTNAQVLGGTEYGLVISLDDPDATRWGIYESGGATNYLTGKLGLGTNAPNVQLDVNGDIEGDLVTSSDGSGHLCYAAGGANGGAYLLTRCASSSSRYKENITDLSSNLGLTAIEKLRPVTFDYRDWYSKDGKNVGFIAEEVAKISPMLVNYNSKGQVENVKYEKITALLVKAVQEQQEEITALQLGGQIANGSLKVDKLEVTNEAVFNGIIQANSDLKVKGLTSFSSNNIGETAILAGAKSVEITFTKKFGSTPFVIVNPIGDQGLDQDIRYSVFNKTPGGFEIKINKEITEDIKFDWYAFTQYD